MDNEKKYDKLNFFYYINDKLLFFDIFAKNNKIIIILPIYIDFNIDYDEIYLYYKDKSLINSKNITNRDFQNFELIYIKIFDFPYNETNVEIIFKYKELTLTYDLYHFFSTLKNFLTVSTLFKNDYKLFNIYYNYYTKQGVEYFYMYYNGIINDDVKNICDKNNVLLLEWNFDYWNNNVIGQHLAQIGQINHYFYKYSLNQSSYIIINDLDEYMYIDNIILKDYLINNNKDFDYFMFQNYWCRTLDSKVEYDNFPNKIIKEKKSNGLFHRCKCIYKPDKFNLMGIHNPHRTNYNYNNFETNNLLLLHFSNWSNENRFMNTDNSDIFIINN
jgi:hypothetical protein